MKQRTFIIFSLLCSLGTTMPAMAQDDFDEDNTEEMARQQNIRQRYAQDNRVYKLTTIKGRTLDLSTKSPVSGIQIQAMGQPRFTAMSDENGCFEIKIPEFVTALYVHAPEFLAQQIAIPADTTQTLTVNMLSDKYRAMYGSETTITARSGFKANHTSALTVDGMLAQQLGADVRSVTRNGIPGAGAMMLIRGIGSLNTDAQPLVVIDGIEQDMQRTRIVLHSGQFINHLGNLSPDDIERVEVLKNATALYGARGANGVIVITTKRGKSMATRIDANIAVGISAIPETPAMMNATQYRTYAMEMIGLMPNADPNGNYKFLNDDPNGYYYHMYHNDTKWADHTYRNALTQQYNVNVQGGDEIGMYNLSVGYSDAQSTIKKNGMNRLNVRFNTDINILWNLSTKFDISISRTQTDVFDDGIPESFSEATITSPTFLSMIKSPLLSPYQYNSLTGSFTSLLSDADDIFSQLGDGFSLANPMAILENGYGDNKNRAENTFFNARLEPTIRLGRHLTLTETFSYSLNRLSQRYFRPYKGVPTFEISELGTVTSMTGSLFSKEVNVLSNTRIQYEHILSAHLIKAFAGFRYNYSSFDDNNLSTQYQSETNDKNPALSVGNGFEIATGTEDAWKNMQMYASADYNYANRYFLTLSLLGEANSRFGENADGMGLFGVKWAIFPSIQTGWVATNERWFPKTRFINHLQLNLGYDISGNDNIPNYAARTSLSSVIYNYNAIGLKLTNIGNDKIQWETTSKMNIGLQAHLVDNRISLAFNYYVHKTKDLLTLKTFDDPIGGINNYWTNGGKIENRGFETSLTFKPVVGKDWHVEAGASIGHYSNKVTSLSDGNYTTSVYGDNNILTSVGNPAGLFYGYRSLGVFETENAANEANLYIKDAAGNRHYFQAGDIHFDDIDNDGMISDKDKTVIGNPNPDIYGNIFATVNWRNLTLSMTWNYSLGNDIYNYQRSILNAGSNLYNQQVQTMGHWRYEGQQTDQPRLSYGDPMGNNRMSNRWIEDGSYLKLKNMRLSYQVPVPGGWSWLQGLSIWAEAENLLTLTRYTGADPETSASNSILYQGIDCGNLPQSRSFTMGLKINL